MEAAGQLPQVIDRSEEFPAGFFDFGGCGIGIGDDLLLDQLQIHGDRDQPLLGAVVEVPDQSLPFGVG